MDLVTAFNGVPRGPDLEGPGPVTPPGSASSYGKREDLGVQAMGQVGSFQFHLCDQVSGVVGKEKGEARQGTEEPPPEQKPTTASGGTCGNGGRREHRKQAK